MPAPVVDRPAPAEFDPYYARYIDLVPDSNVVDALRTGIAETRRLIEPLGEDRGEERYAPGKWSVKEVLGHVSDSERIFTYRALRFARGDAAPLPGFDQDDYVAAGGYSGRMLRDVLRELAAVRQATVALFESLTPEAWARQGTANGVVVSVRALAFIIAGHEIHHRKILEERYLR